MSSDRALLETPPEALALLEIDGMARAIRTQDAALKKAPVKVLACAPVTPGKAILIFVGDVASVEESLDEAIETAGSRLIDRMVLPGIHPEVVAALIGGRRPRGDATLAVMELASVAAAIEAADAALKAAEVGLGRLHPATGFGGKGLVTLWGPLADVQAAADAAAELAGDRLLDLEIIPAPHDELDDAAFKRPWPLDPAG